MIFVDSISFKSFSSMFWTLIILLNLFLPIVSGSSNISNVKEGLQCNPGLLFPVWEPTTNLALGDIIARGVIYFVALVYMFVGVSIVADKFMAAIEVITSQERQVIIKKPNSEPQIISVRIWNETVSNLTLMALGSSAPEILLSIIEVYAQDFNAGELGPGTIVGSAAFNMFVIIAICVWCVPSTEYKKIKHLRVFFVTMIWSVFAYIWLCLILSWTSYGVIDIWEGLLTFMLFPATVITAYIADRRLLIYKYLSKKYRMNRRGIIVGGEGADDMELGMTKLTTNHVIDGGFKVFEEEADEEVREFEEHRREYIQLLRELRKKNPDASMNEIEIKARDEIMNRGPKSRAFYRLQATKKLTGGNALVKRRVDVVGAKKDSKAAKEDIIKIFFDPAHYTVMENVGQFAVTISREGDAKHTVCVDFKTEDGTANAGSDYEPIEGTLIFRPHEVHKQVFITVIDDDVFEEDEHFYVRLSNPRYLSHDGQTPMNGTAIGQNNKPLPYLQLGTPAIATVMILDDDHSGIFSFPEPLFEVSESIGEYHLRVKRFSGARGKVYVPFKTLEGTAKDEKDFEMTSGHVVFDNNETEQLILLHIIDNETYEKDAVFYVELGEPVREEDFIKESTDSNENSPNLEISIDEKIALLGKPRLGEINKCQIRIKESKEFKNTVDKLISKANTTIMIGTSSWKEQFIDAITVSAGDEDEDGEEGEEREEKLPTCSDYVMHFFTLFWKIIFAFVPPTDYLNGWVCFVISIIMIGALTAMIGDLASHFGCTIGLKDAVTALAFVALGTSVPELNGGWACFVSSIICIGILTAIVGDLASHFGCTVGLKDSVTAISFVALGTSIPDTFASKVAAQNDKYADSSIGNVTGSNAVNVFLGIGIAWTLAAIVHAFRGTTFRVDPGNLVYSVTLFCVCAFFCCIVLMFRRRLGGELGGPMLYKLPTVLLFVGFWVFYVLMSSLEAYKIIPGF